MKDTKLTSEIIHQNLKNLPDWSDIDEIKITKTFKFENFLESIEFVNKIAKIAEKNQHHPDIHIYYNQVNIQLYSHSAQGITEKDFILANQIEDILKA